MTNAVAARFMLATLVYTSVFATTIACGADPFIALGAPPDSGWKPVRAPKFLAPDQFEAADSFSTSHPIEGIGAFIDGVAKFYPLDIMQYHLIVSDGPYIITFSPLTKVGLVLRVDPWGSNVTFATGCLFMSDLLISTNATSGSEWSPTLTALVVNNGETQQSLVVANETKATIIEWRLWKSFTAGGSLVLSRDTGPGLKYYNVPMYTKYYSTDTILFASPFDSRVAPYDLDKPKSSALVVNVTGDIRIYPTKSLDTASDFTIVKQGGVDVGIFVEFRSSWVGALILPPGRNISVDYDSASVASSLILIDADKHRWNLWGSPVDATGKPMDAPSYEPLQRPHQFSMLFFAAASFFGSRPILAYSRGTTDCWDHRQVTSAETVLGIKHSVEDLGSCINVDRSIIPQGTAPGPSMVLAAIGSLVFIIAVAAVAAIFFRRRLRRKPSLQVPYAQVTETETKQEEMVELDEGQQ
eukprot:TRINITY_DN6227_c0_g1_i1.p1 TRINITY_DN6227_c0_g1~~TRINITY_DN6227_c0_g1_i1.p1  ORF type:complete len:470 (-),score=44.23 TRINITY_DN6227_c0_g1_i1:973-2382(-)